MSNQPFVALELISSDKRLPNPLKLQAEGSYFVGTAPNCAVQLTDESVRPRHAKLTVEPQSAYIEPVGRASLAVNGATVTQKTAINSGDWLVIGKQVFQIKRSDAPVLPHASPYKRLTVGRVAESDIQIDSPLVSREHAVLTQESGQWYIQDLGSTNGAFVNGSRLVGRQAIKEGDRIDIATFAFVFHEDNLAAVDGQQHGLVRLSVDKLSKRVRHRKSGKPMDLLSDISLTIEPGEFVVIFGTTGSGKSTLLDALSGRRAASSGGVYYNGADLYRHFDRYRGSIGYVPQQDIVHRKIKVSKALEYTARLRLPSDMKAEEIDHHVQRVLRQVGLEEKANLAVDTPEPLSGGQLKRVNLGVELVANPNVLFMDEPTTGLDAGTDKRMMKLFEELAHQYKKTVVCVTHTLENIDHCDLVILMHRGKMVYFGPPDQACKHFGINKLSEVYELLESRDAVEWERRFRNSDLYYIYVVARHVPKDEMVAAKTVAKGKSGASFFDARQAGTLLRRYLDILGGDRLNLAILFLQAPLIGILVGLVFGQEYSKPLDQVKAYGNTLFILVLSAIWFGCLNSAREIVKELPIYRRERSINLGIAPYITSKMLPLTLLALLQCLLLVATVEALCDLPGDWNERVAALFLIEVSATLLGLWVSSLVNTSDKAVGLIPILLIPQVILSGAIVPLNDLMTQIAKGTMISYWGFDAMKATLPTVLELASPLPREQALPLATDWDTALGVVVVMGITLLLATAMSLKLQDRNG